jgi:hypothetical protein
MFNQNYECKIKYPENYILHLKLYWLQIEIIETLGRFCNSSTVLKYHHCNSYKCHQNIWCLLFPWCHPFSHKMYSNLSEQHHNNHFRCRNGSCVHPGNRVQIYCAETWLRHAVNEYMHIYLINTFGTEQTEKRVQKWRRTFRNWRTTWSWLRPSWEAASSAATHEFPSILWNRKVHYRVHKSNIALCYQKDVLVTCSIL